MGEVGEVLAQAVADLTQSGARFALVGGLAVSVRSEPRFTRDADLVVAVGDDAAAEGVILRLRRRGYVLLGVVEQEAVGRMATCRLRPPGERGEGVVVDLIFATSGIEAEIVAASERVEALPGVVVPVAQVGHLIAMKVLSADPMDRPQDLVDLRALSTVATSADARVAREAVAAIDARGFARGRDLVHLLEIWLDASSEESP